MIAPEGGGGGGGGMEVSYLATKNVRTTKVFYIGLLKNIYRIIIDPLTLPFYTTIAFKSVCFLYLNATVFTVHPYRTPHVL